MAGVTRMANQEGDFLIAKVDLNGFVGGDSDPITPLNVRSIKAITPTIIDFVPSVTDISSQISIVPITPTVTTPAIQIHIIHTSDIEELPNQ